MDEWLTKLRPAASVVRAEWTFDAKKKCDYFPVSRAPDT
jgi:hypothetical protein